jgi:hypothetical protein
LRQAYGGHEILFVENGALRNIVGPENLVTGGHHDAGTQQPWLFGVDFGSWNYADYTTPASINAVFSINFGSGKLDFSNWNNTMKAMLAQPWYGLVTAWGGRPSWQLHHMALGKPVGYSHMRTVNNGSRTQGNADSLEYTPTGVYTWLNPVWVNLLGDPTLHAFPLQPVSNLRAEPSAGGVQLEWEPAEPGMQYRVYRAEDRYGPYQPLNSATLIDETSYLDAGPVTGAWYMVRAHALKEVYAGSFFMFSQGTFATVGNTTPEATDQLLSATAGSEIPVHLAASDADSDNDLVMAIINGPEKGHLAQVNGEWRYYPDANFTGQVTIPFTVFDGVASDQGLISVDISVAEASQLPEPAP